MNAGQLKERLADIPDECPIFFWYDEKLTEPLDWIQLRVTHITDESLYEELNGEDSFEQRL